MARYASTERIQFAAEQELSIGMNAPIPHRRLVCCVGFATGATSMLLGDRLERLAEARYFSSFPNNFGFVDRCSWIAPCVMLIALVLSSVFGIVVCRTSSSNKLFLLRCWAVGFAAFVFGLMLAAGFIPARI